MNKKELVMILVLGMFCFSFVSASNLLTKIDFEISGFSGISSLDNSNGTDVVVSIHNSSGNVVVSRNATAGVYLENMTITMQGDKFNLSYSTLYTYNLSTSYGDFLYNFTTPAEATSGASIVTTWNDSKDYYLITVGADDNATVLDTQNNLRWQDGDSGATLNWTNAIAYCDGLSWGGYDDWRLPNIGEGISLIKFSYGGDSFWPTAFGVVDNLYFWTSTENPAYTAYAYIVDMDFGNVGGYDKADSDNLYARCVRSEN